MDFLTNLTLIILLIIGAAYFAMSEIALAGSRKVRLTSMAEDGDRRAAQVLQLKENPGYFFSVVQVGINLVAILGGVVGEEVFGVVFEPVLALFLPEQIVAGASLTCSVAFVTVLFVMFADLIPKRVAMSCPEQVAVRTIRSMLFLIWILKPIVWLLTIAANAIMRAMSVPLKNQDKITNEDIMATVEAGAAAGVIAPIEHTAITNVMDLESHLVPSAMTARDSIVYFTLDEDYESIARKISETPHDKYLVCSTDIDHVIGCLDAKELLTRYVNKETFSLKEGDLVRPAITIPDSLTLTETLDLFKHENSDFAVIINEYGLTVGVITLKDIMWLVMGNYFATAGEAQMVKRADGVWVIDGATPVDDIERQFDIESMPEEETYETVAGFMMYMLRRVPKRGDHVDFAGYRFEVTSVAGFRIDQLHMKKLDHPSIRGAKTGDKPNDAKADRTHADKPAEKPAEKPAGKSAEKAAPEKSPAEDNPAAE